MDYGHSTRGIGHESKQRKFHLNIKVLFVCLFAFTVKVLEQVAQSCYCGVAIFRDTQNRDIGHSPG